MKKKLSLRQASQFADQHELERAGQLFSTFHQKTPKKHLLVALDGWPKDGRFSVAETATRTGYVSNKWEGDGDWTEYSHEHERPLPSLLVPKERGLPDASVRVFPPTALAWLGYALDIEVKRGSGFKHWSFQKGSRSSFPSLCAIPHPTKPRRHVLVILPSAERKGDPILLLESPRLVVTERGLEY